MHIFSNSKIFCAVAVLALVFLPILPAEAAVFDAGETYALGPDAVVADNLYVAGGTTAFSGSVLGDLLSLGGLVTVSGAVDGDAALAGGTVDVFGSLGDDVRIVGGQITVGSDVPGDLVIVGGTIQVLPDVVVGGDVVVAGGAVFLDGTALSDVRVYGGDVVFGGAVRGDAEVHASEKITFRDSVSVDGDLLYSAPERADVPEGAVLGEVSYERSKVREAGIGGMVAFAGFFALLKLLVALATSIAAVLVFRRFSERVGERVLSHTAGTLLTGFLVLVAVPVAAVLLLMTFIGSFIGVIALAGYALLVMLAAVWSGIVAGAFLSRWIVKKPQADWRWTAIGVIALHFLFLVPLVGWALQFVVWMFALGALSHMTYQHLRRGRG